MTSDSRARYRPASILRDTALCAWFAIVALAYWAPSLGIASPFWTNLLSALYAVFLVLTITVVAFRVVHRPQEPAADAPRTEAQNGD